MNDYRPNAPTGVILMNLGTPSEPTVRGVRNFLRAFLSDPRVVELPRVLWLPILYGFILPFRSPRVARLYKQIWTDGGSPLKVITEAQAAALQQRFSPETMQVTYAMTYGEPSFEQRVEELERRGVENILVLPLYPQYSATTTASIYDQYARLIMQQRVVSSIQVHKHYYDSPDYIRALAESINDYWLENPRPQRLLFSFHGIPKRCVDRGDPYEIHCRSTAEAVVEELKLGDSEWAISFQSRLGKAEWLQPYTDKLLQQWAETGVASVHVVCPAFSADCLETIEEIDVENRKLFLAHGGRTYGVIPCLNDSERHISMMEKIVRSYV